VEFPTGIPVAVGMETVMNPHGVFLDSNFHTSHSVIVLYFAYCMHSTV